MPKRKEFIKNKIYHIYNKSFDGTVLFIKDNNYKRFLSNLLEYLNIYKTIDLLSYSILPNHFHLIIKNLENGYSVSNFMCKLLGNYACYYRSYYLHEKGTKVFKGRFNAKIIEDNNYYERCLTYVNLNAYKHGYVQKISEWKYTSYQEIIAGKSKFINIKYLEALKNIILNNKDYIKNQYDDYEFEF